MIKVLFVCLGNICRSPLAEGVFADKIEQANLSKKISCDSAGTSNYHIGSQPDPRSVANARQNGIMLDHHARQFTEHDFDEFDYILAMDESNLHHIQRMENADGGMEYQLFKMRHFDNEGTNEDVPDPYYGGEQGFQLVFDILDRSCDQLLQYIRDRHNL